LDKPKAAADAFSTAEGAKSGLSKNFVNLSMFFFGIAKIFSSLNSFTLPNKVSLSKFFFE
jgi:hypothetical protein